MVHIDTEREGKLLARDLKPMGDIKANLIQDALNNLARTLMGEAIPTPAGLSILKGIAMTQFLFVSQIYLQLNEVIAEHADNGLSISVLETIAEGKYTIDTEVVQAMARELLSLRTLNGLV